MDMDSLDLAVRVRMLRVTGLKTADQSSINKPSCTDMPKNKLLLTDTSNETSTG